MPRLEKKHPLAIRWFHWINFPVLFIMIWSGMLIYWAYDNSAAEGTVDWMYRIGWGKVTLFHFFPEWVYAKFGFAAYANGEFQGSRLGEGMAWHFAFMWVFAINGLLYVTYTALSGEWRYLVPNRNSFREAIHVVLHDLHLTKVPLPRRKFNGAQQFAYTGVVLMGLGSLLSGLAIYKSVQVGWLTALLGGYQMARWEHFWLTMGYLAFFVVHIVQVAKAGWNNFRAMVCGYELVEEHE